MPRLPPPKAMAIHSGPTGGPSSASPGSEFSSSAASLADPYYMPVLESSEDDLGVASYDPTTEGDDDAEEEFTLKSEPQDDDDLLASIKDDYESELSPVDAQVNTPNRRRGRPRKELIPEPVLSKAPKPRSKTGCKTCRKRKKKCDEGRPGCDNCKKNGVICEGYPIKSIWKSGKQKIYTHPQPCPANPPLVNGVETDEDRYFFDHFFSNISYKLSCRNDGENPFVVLLMPMALEHQGLMHSILALSGSHLMIREPAKYENRRFHHYSRAIQILSETIAKCNTTGNNSLPDDPTVASTLIMCVNTVCEGDTNGMYRPHLDGIGELVRQRLRTLSAAPGKASAFSRFLIEFFLYHDTLRSMTGLDRRPSFFGNLELPNFMDPKRAGSLIGVIDGLFNIISKITKLRDQLRSRGLAGKGRGEDFETTSEALSIDSDLRQWTPSQPPGHPHYHGAQVYRQCVCIYLFRTIMPSQKHPTITQAVDVGLDLLQQTQASTGIESILLMPIFILGCAAFDAEQRPVVSQYFDTVQEWSSLGNVGPTRAVVERIWQLMDAEDPLSWDWETVMRNMGYDFLIA